MEQLRKYRPGQIGKFIIQRPLKTTVTCYPKENAHENYLQFFLYFYEHLLGPFIDNVLL